jgi:hypothetical protein
LSGGIHMSSGAYGERPQPPRGALYHRVEVGADRFMIAANSVGFR